MSFKCIIQIALLAKTLWTTIDGLSMQEYQSESNRLFEITVDTDMVEIKPNIRYDI